MNSAGKVSLCQNASNPRCGDAGYTVQLTLRSLAMEVRTLSSCLGSCANTMFSMVAFLAAFSYECFVARDRVAVWSTGAVWIIVGLSVLWCIYSAWEGKEDSWYKRAIAAYEEKVQSLREHAQNAIRLYFPCIFPALSTAAPDV